jgi:hypothetical protein
MRRAATPHRATIAKACALSCHTDRESLPHLSQPPADSHYRAGRCPAASACAAALGLDRLSVALQWGRTAPPIGESYITSVRKSCIRQTNMYSACENGNSTVTAFARHTLRLAVRWSVVQREKRWPYPAAENRGATVPKNAVEMKMAVPIGSFPRVEFGNIARH